MVGIVKMSHFTKTWRVTINTNLNSGYATWIDDHPSSKLRELSTKLNEQEYKGLLDILEGAKKRVLKEELSNEQPSTT